MAEDKDGSLVKRLRRRPLTAESGVRFPYELLIFSLYGGLNTVGERKRQGCGALVFLFLKKSFLICLLRRHLFSQRFQVFGIHYLKPIYFLFLITNMLIHSL